MIEEDLEVYLYTQSHRKTKQAFRLIKAIILESGERINFLTNMMALSAEEVTEIYRLRWDIELFFKFLKQEFDFKHFLSRNENGLRVMMLYDGYRSHARLHLSKTQPHRRIQNLQNQVCQ